MNGNVSYVKGKAVAGRKRDAIEVKRILLKRVKPLWLSDEQSKDHRIPPGTVWTQQLSASISQWKTTIENETKEEKRERRGRRKKGRITKSAFYPVSRDETGVNGDWVKLR